MKVQKLWFVRHGGRVSGPFPAKLISQDWILGRFQASDEASVDRVFWAEIKDIPELQPHITQLKNRIVGSADAPLDWEKERREAALRWVDERHQADRRDQAGPQPPASNRRGDDRRTHPDNSEWAALRQHHAAVQDELKKRRERFVGIGLALLGLLALVLYAVFNFAPVNPVKVGLHGPEAICSDAAGARVNWIRCDKNGAWLKGVNLSSAQLRETHFNAANLSHSNLSFANLMGSDLSFANLQQAKLVGANLSSANLSYAELRDADLRYADLRGAKLDGASLIGARLDAATWADGRKCLAISVGSCK
jgi:hypothetical protein